MDISEMPFRRWLIKQQYNEQRCHVYHIIGRNVATFISSLIEMAWNLQSQVIIFSEIGNKLVP